MIDRNELKSQIDTVVNANGDFYTADQVSEIADEIMGLDGFSLEKGDDVDAVNSDVFDELTQDVDDGTKPGHYTESEWRESEF